MASEIARIAQKRVVEVEQVSFACGPVTLKMVKTTLGLGWLLNDTVLFTSDEHAVKAFILNIKTNAESEDYYFNVRFGGTDTVVWSIHRFKDASKKYVSELISLLRTPPVLID